MFTEETFLSTIGSAVYIKNTNDVGVTIFDRCIFDSNYGAIAGSINMDNAGALLLDRNIFNRTEE